MLHCNANPKTNAKAISHGCFRVDEIDMEKIVSNVGKGTPIVILNNTIDIKEIKDKLFQVTIWPDVYKTGQNNIDKLKEKFGEHSINWDELSTDIKIRLKGILEDADGRSYTLNF